MASTARTSTDDARRPAVSPRPKGRENAKDTLCRNVTIYGHCRYENKGCAFNHDQSRGHGNADGVKKRLNVDSPSFTPSSIAAPAAGVNGGGPAKSFGLSPKAANAAPFKPKGLGAGFGGAENAAVANKYNPAAPDWSLPSSSVDIPEFLPQPSQVQPPQALQQQQPSIPPNLAQNAPQGDANGLHGGLFDPFNPSASLANANHAQSQTPLGMFGADAGAPGGNAPYFQTNTYAQPLQYHLYTSLGPHRDTLLPAQRTVHDFFIPDNLREDLQRKSAATLQTLPNSSLPPQIDYFHSLVPLDTTNQKNAALFGYPSWVYKAVSSKDGNTYALRRLEGFRLTNEKAIRSVQAWKRVINGNVVTVVDAFTNRSFGDSSLLVVTDYYPLAKTLSEVHFAVGRFGARSQPWHVTEQTLWSYVIQIGNALKAIHGAGLAARIIDASKILVTSKNRIRLNACAVLDIVQHDNVRNIIDLQREDFAQFGCLVLAIGTNSPGAAHNIPKAVEQFSRNYSQALKDRVVWLLSATNPGTPTGLGSKDGPSIDRFLSGLEMHVFAALDANMHLNDSLMSNLNRELENSRITRLLVKLNLITERPDYNHDRQWAETGERFPIKLFRDYVFHQVDAQGAPVLDLAHILACLNKLDAGSEEKMVLTSRDEQMVLVVSYKEMKRAVDGAFGDLTKAARGRN